MNYPFYAMIVPMGPIGQPPGIWGPTDPRPGVGPIVPGGPGGGGGPPGIWGPTDPRPGVGPIIPGGPGGGQPPGIWGGGNVPMPNPPIHLGPGGGTGGEGIWGGGNVPMPSPPIFIPDPKPPELPPVDVLEPGEVLIITKNEEGELSWAKMRPGPPYNPPSGGAVPTPHQGGMAQPSSGSQQYGTAQAGQQARPGQPQRPPTQTPGRPPQR